MVSDRQELFKKTILKHLYFNKELSCTDLTQLTGRSLPHTTKALNELVKEGLVIESGYAISTGGRRPQMYSVRQDYLYILSVAMDQFMTSICILDMSNRMIGEERVLELDLSAHPDGISILGQELKGVMEQSGIPKEKFAGIGIGMPGFVDVTKGVNYSFFDTPAKSINEYLEIVTGIPVSIDNDSSLIALAEWKLGEARHRQHALVINIGWGIGLGMVLNGSLFRGENGFAGEFSHIPLFTNNKICSCGKMGCLETETSLSVIAEKAIAGIQAGRTTVMKGLSMDNRIATYHQIMDAAIKGDKYAVELLSEAGYHIGRGIAILIHLFNPKLVILSGRGTKAGKLWLAPVQHALNEHCIPKIAENVEIRISSLGYAAERLGAAALVMENLDKAQQSKA
ncbi:Sugar kinase of the NBD/HSP70 family, may contain an N-terminal HTH domain [Chitinophaga eiseniae]|uniref:Sugar kinase of the NBD/HSP70 family, may contain an N-terminal HTH domain n=1 Tax=Chitinophaga eiseniae TaxID=634771 RepID=A0A1T4Q0L9_9BACT|nr:ROK family transcriptional regulator [Chitinophaga eiseniae]SJZ97322.1 Sugar kinase of the NBD/HSP70 family, may contain an N-terminal HTH domain [Chitinophaga eiseniae]